MARLKQRLVNAFNFAAPSCVNGGFFSATFAARSISFSSRGTAPTSSDVSSASAARKSLSSAAAAAAASAASTAPRRVAKALDDVELVFSSFAFAFAVASTPRARRLANRSTSADMTSSRVTREEGGDDASSPPASRIRSASAALSFQSRAARAVAASSTLSAASAVVSAAPASLAARASTPRARRRVASSPATSTGTCRHAAVRAAASAEASAALASARISASIASASPPFTPNAPPAPASAPTARASASASSSATYPAPCGCFLAASNARRTRSLASFRFTDLPSRMRVRFSMRTRSASRSCFAGRPLATPRANESSIHSVSTTNGTPSSRSVSAAFTMPSPSDSAAVSFPGELTFTITTNRFSPLVRVRAVVPSLARSGILVERYDTSEVIFSRSYVPNEYGLSGQSFSKNRRSDSASTWFFRFFADATAPSEAPPRLDLFSTSRTFPFPKPSTPSSSSESSKSSNTAGFRGSKICGAPAEAPRRTTDPPPLASSAARELVAPRSYARIPAAALSAEAVISTARSVIAVVGCVQPSHSGNANKGPSESFVEPFADEAESSFFSNASSNARPRAERAPMAASELGGPPGLARSSGIGTCMATLGLSPTATLSTGNEVTSATMASCTSRVTRSADVLVSKCHCSMLSRKSTRAPGTTAGGAGAWYIVTPMRCARPSRELSQPPGPSPPGAAAARTTRA